MSKPHINVTPLIDVLLVLLIIFMVISPLKPSSFKAKIPQEPDRTNDVDTPPDPETLIVSLGLDSSLTLNKEPALGTVTEPGPMIERLRAIFHARKENGAFIQEADGSSGRIQKTVFIKAPLKTGYGDVAKVIDAVKIAGADPISLQIDALD